MDAYAKSKTPKEARDKRATPPAVFSRFQNIFGLRFNFDVCAEDHTAKALSYWTIETSPHTLDRSWAKDIAEYLGGKTMPIIWMNPPYSDPGTWCEKAMHEARQGALVVGLVPDDRSTSWYQKYIEGQAAAIFIPDKRISFLDQDGVPQNGNPKGSVFVLWAPWQTSHTAETRFTLEPKE